MNTRDDRRSEALDRIAQHLLQAGLPGSGLRSLAAAAEMSDRMLLYYFKNKNEVLTLALGMLAAQMAEALDQSMPLAPERSFTALRREIRKVVGGHKLRPFMRLWLEIVSRASRDEPPYNQFAKVIAHSFLDWISARLHANHNEESALLLATVEGIVMLDAIGCGALADAAVLARRK